AARACAAPTPRGKKGESGGAPRRDCRHNRLDAKDIQCTRQIVGEHSAISLATLGRVFIKKRVAAIRILIVPKGCSTVSRRVRMAPGFLSSLACTASTISSFSHRVMRRSLPVVQ